MNLKQQLEVQRAYTAQAVAPPEASERDRMLFALDEAGVAVDRRWGLDRLRAAAAEAGL